INVEQVIGNRWRMLQALDVPLIIVRRALWAAGAGKRDNVGCRSVHLPRQYSAGTGLQGFSDLNRNRRLAFVAESACEHGVNVPYPTAAVKPLFNSGRTPAATRCLKLNDTQQGSKSDQKSIRWLTGKRHPRKSGVDATNDGTNEPIGTPAPTLCRSRQRRQESSARRVLRAPRL